MTSEELRGRLHALSAGAMETVSWPEFFGLFREQRSEKEQRHALAGLAEQCGCAVFFIRSYAQFALFTRKQPNAGATSEGEPAAA